jgi:hypothetical protein
MRQIYFMLLIYLSMAFRLNETCIKGKTINIIEDEMFAKDPACLVPLHQPPYYGIKGSGGGVGGTLGRCAMGLAVNSGRIAGESAAEYVLGK